MTEPTNKEQYLNIADQCTATATSELAASILVDGGRGTLRQLLNDAADAIRAGWCAPQPTQAQAGAVPLTESEMGEGWRKFQETLDDSMAADPAGVRNMGREHWLSWAHWKAACNFARGIKGGQHGSDT